MCNLYKDLAVVWLNSSSFKDHIKFFVCLSKFKKPSVIILVLQKISNIACKYLCGFSLILEIICFNVICEASPFLCKSNWISNNIFLVCIDNVSIFFNFEITIELFLESKANFLMLPIT
jgi:hypothetical protein